MTMFPDRTWTAYEEILKAIGERRIEAIFADGTGFLHELGLVDSNGMTLTAAGHDYFSLRFIRNDQASSDALLQKVVMAYPPVAAVCQLLDGVPSARREAVETVLRSQGFGDELNDRRLGSLLALMHRAGVVKYTKNKAIITVLVHPSRMATPPPSVFISPQTPYANKVWLRRVLEECEGFIYWLDKHFLPVGFEPLWEAADGNRISEIHIISLKLPENEGKRALRSYRDLIAELSGRDIAVEWRTIESQLIRGTHDRWIIGSKSARNIPDVVTIFSGNHSELNRSEQYEELKSIFENYWKQATPVN
jgi:hypothetical protein